eukprot:400294-Rhodomonas_salina.1
MRSSAGCFCCFSWSVHRVRDVPFAMRGTEIAQSHTSACAFRYWDALLYPIRQIVPDSGLVLLYVRLGPDSAEITLERVARLVPGVKCYIPTLLSYALDQ